MIQGVGELLVDELAAGLVERPVGLHVLLDLTRREQPLQIHLHNVLANTRIISLPVMRIEVFSSEATCQVRPRNHDTPSMICWNSIRNCARRPGSMRSLISRAARYFHKMASLSWSSRDATLLWEKLAVESSMPYAELSQASVHLHPSSRLPADRSKNIEKEGQET